LQLPIRNRLRLIRSVLTSIQLETLPSIPPVQKPVIVALSIKQFASLVETMEILSDQEFMSELREGIRQADLGQTVSLESLKLNLGF
jgi:hypothetical protein